MGSFANPNATLSRVCGMPDEPSWSHARRLLRENGIYDVRALTSILRCQESPKVLKSFQFREMFFHLLAGGEGTLDFRSYFMRHCMLPQLTSAYYFGWRSDAMHRWMSHHANYYPSPVVERSCPRCTLEDIANHGFSWFRRDHQLPGVNWCLLHECGLNEQASQRLLFQPRSFLEIGPTASATPFLQIQGFVRRYLIALNWLRNSSGYLQWETATAVIESASGGLFSYRDSSFCDHITSAAPPAWYFANFLDKRAIGRSRLVPALKHRTAWLALAVATIAESDGDVDELIRSAKSKILLASQRSQE